MRVIRYTLQLVITFILIVLSAPAFAVEQTEQLKMLEAKLRKMLGNGVLPIIDVEFHYGSKIDIEDVKGRMNDNGVGITWLGTNEKLGSSESLRLSTLYPEYFVPTTVHGDGKLWHSGDKFFLDNLAIDVKSGKYLAMGEFEARHYVSSTNNRDIHTPVDSPAMQTVFGLSSETGIPFLIHHEAEDSLLPELERMLVKYPKAVVVWCHVGRNRNFNTWRKFKSAAAVKEYLKKYPNLYFDLVASRPGSKFEPTGQIDAIMYDFVMLKTILLPEWKELFEEFPDRFLIGTDINTGRFSKYDNTISTFRTVILDSLRKETAEKIAFKNAWKLMTRQKWKE